MKVRKKMYNKIKKFKKLMNNNKILNKLKLKKEKFLVLIKILKIQNKNYSSNNKFKKKMLKLVKRFNKIKKNNNN